MAIAVAEPFSTETNSQSCHCDKRLFMGTRSTIKLKVMAAVFGRLIVAVSAVRLKY